jgi:GMP synthase-like glutamine amidotransferase
MARKLRAEHIYCKILPATATAAEILAQEPLGILLAGGDTGEASVFPEGCGWTKTGLPLLAMGDAALGLCLALGGTLTSREDTPAWRRLP